MIKKYILISLLGVIPMCFSECTSASSISVLATETADKSFFEKDEAYVFYTNETPKLIFASKDKGLVQRELTSNSFFISPAFSDKVRFKVELKETFIDKAEFTTKGKVLSVSDIEGNCKGFIQFLKNNQVIDDNLKWIFGNGHLVCNGDFFDRGTDVTATLWLIYKLEKEAEVAGGKVHFVLGNHDVMNLQGDDRYVQNKYKILAKTLKIPYKDLYGENTELGRWLRTKNTIIKINDVLYTHAGISPSFLSEEYTIEETNDLVRNNLNKKNTTIKEDSLRAYFLLRSEGPMWYRGYFKDYKDKYERATQQEVNRICDYFRVSKIVVGHSIVDGVKTMYEGKIIAIDVVEKEVFGYEGNSNEIARVQGLLIEGGAYFVAYSHQPPKPIDESTNKK